MTFKEKHLHQAFGTLAVSMAMLLPTGCTTEQTKDNKSEQKIGLLDSTPHVVTDKYNDNVTLHLVNVPIYNKDGTPKENQSVLTRGIRNSSYSPAGDVTYICKVRLNGSETWHYVKTDKNHAIYTENGFSGLFVDKDGEAVVVKDENVPDFVKWLDVQRDAAKKQDNYNLRNSDRFVEISPKDTATVKVESSDSTITEIMPLPTDTTKNEITTPVANSLDSLMKRQEVRE